MLAVIESGNKQYHVKVGDVIKVEKLVGEIGTMHKFDKVLMIGDKVGNPVIPSAKVVGEILEQKKNEKEIIFKKKRRHNYRRKKGHRQQITVLRIKGIEA